MQHTKALWAPLLLLGGCSVMVDTAQYRGERDEYVDSGEPISLGDSAVRPDADGPTPDDDGGTDEHSRDAGAHDASPDAGTALDAGSDAALEAAPDANMAEPDAALADAAPADAARPEHEPDAQVDAGSDGPEGPESAPITFKRLVTGDMSSLVIGADGRPLVFFHGKAEESNDLGVVRCNDPECLSTNTRALDVPDHAGVHVRALVDREGKPVVSYQEMVHGQAKFLRCGDATCKTHVSFTLEQAAGLGQWSAITLANNGFPLVSYYDAEARDLRAALCTQPDCCDVGKSCAETSERAPALFTVAGTHSHVGQQGAVAVGGDGLPVFAYYDESAGGLGFARCSDALCSGPIDSRVLDTAGAAEVGQHASMTIGRDGFPLIFYFDATHGDLKRAKCNDAACLNPDIRVVDGAGAGDPVVGQYTSIAMPSDGLALVSYYDASQRDLKVAKCRDSACSSAHVHRVDGASEEVGEWTSLSLRPGSERPVISYATVESGKRRLRLAFCGNDACYDAALAR
jgi:hypothetical protein